MEIKFVESAVFIFLIICLYFFDELGNILTELSDFSPIKSEKPIVTSSPVRNLANRRPITITVT